MTLCGTLRKILKSILQETDRLDPYGSFPFCPSGQGKGITPRHRSREATLGEATDSRPSVGSYVMVEINPGIKFIPFMARMSLWIILYPHSS